MIIQKPNSNFMFFLATKHNKLKINNMLQRKMENEESRIRIEYLPGELTFDKLP